MDAYNNEKFKMPPNTVTSTEFTYLSVYQFSALITKCQVLLHLLKVKGMELDLDRRHETKMELRNSDSLKLYYSENCGVLGWSLWMMFSAPTKMLELQ